MKVAGRFARFGGRLVAIRNVEPLDRLLRIMVGCALLAAVVAASSAWRWLGLVGLLPLLSGLAGYCPFYAWLSRD